MNDHLIGGFVDELEKISAQKSKQKSKRKRWGGLQSLGALLGITPGVILRRPGIAALGGGIGLVGGGIATRELRHIKRNR